MSTPLKSSWRGPLGHTSKQLPTAAQAAVRLGLKVARIGWRIREGTIPYFKLGRALRLPDEAIESLKAAGYTAAIAKNENQ